MSRGRSLPRLAGYHVLFGLAILCLSALVAWWSIFIENAIEQQHRDKVENLLAGMNAMALQKGHDRAYLPREQSPLADDARLEVLACTRATNPYHVSLDPFWPTWCLQARDAYLAELEGSFNRRIVMVAGESAVLIVVILVTVFMLYRMISTERRHARELGEFFSRVTHELKTPITGIKALLQTLKAQELEREQLLPILDLALRQVERQEMLAENILVGRRMVTTDLGREPSVMDVGRFVDGFLTAHQGLLGRMDAHLEVEGPGLALADPDGLRVILENLMDNALKYAVLPCRIRIAVSGTPGAPLRLTFSDNGQGFAPDKAEAIFDAYRRLNEELPGSSHGTGMGLYLSRRLARRMGGDLTAHSEGPGRGASFTLTLKTPEEG